MNITKRILVVLLAAALLLAAACSAPKQREKSASPSVSAEADATAAPEESAPGAAWVNSDISGNVTAELETDPKEDFNAAVN